MITSTSSDRAEALHGVVNAAATVSADDANAAMVFRAAGSGDSGVATAMRIVSCQAITYRFWAAKLDIPLDDVQLDVEGDPNAREFFGQQDGVRRLASR